MELNESQVIFDPHSHTYSLLGKKISGITNVIKERICPDKYAFISEAVLNKAAEEGTRMHNAVELFENYGLYNDSVPELAGYIKEKENSPYLRKFVRSEYIVTDNMMYASGIDLVFEDPNDCSSAILVDLKRTAVLDKEYVSWQLSIYAHFFEQQNPTIRVNKTFALHLRNDLHELVEVSRHNTEDVHKMLYTEAMLPTATSDSRLYPQIAAAESAIAEMKRRADEAKAKYDRLTSGIMNLMANAGIKKYDGTNISISRTMQSTTMTLDTKRLKEEEPDIYNKYLKETIRQGGLRIKIKNQCATDG